MRNKLSAAQTYYIYVGMTAFLIILMKTVREIYRIEIVELNPFYLVMMGTTMEITHLLFEIPTGIVADRFSRKLSVIIGLCLVGTSLLLEGLFPFLIVVFICQIILGVGNTFTSGADEAWLADEVGSDKLEHVLIKGTQIGLLLSIVGILTSIIIGSILLNLPFIIGGSLFIGLAVFLMLFMTETNHIKMEKHHDNSFRHMVASIKIVIRFIKQKPVLVLMVSVSLIYGLYSEGFDRLWIAHIIEDTSLPNYDLLSDLITTFPYFRHVLSIGLINLSAMVVSLLAVEYIKRKLVKTGKLQKVWLLVFINLLMVVSLFAFALTDQFYLAISFYMTFYWVRRINRPVYRAWMNQHIDSPIRATVLSTFGQLDSIGQIIGGTIVATFALKTSISTGIMMSALILSPVVVLYLLFILKIKRNQHLNY